MTERQLKEAQIISLKAKLSSEASRIGDWAIIKCYEAKMAGKELPYDLDQLIADRQAVRDQINQIEEELKSMPSDNQ